MAFRGDAVSVGSHSRDYTHVMHVTSRKGDSFQGRLLSREAPFKGGPLQGIVLIRNGPYKGGSRIREVPREAPRKGEACVFNCVCFPSSSFLRHQQ